MKEENKLHYSFDNEKFEVPTEATSTEETNEQVSGKVTSSDEPIDEVSDLGDADEYSSSAEPNNTAKNDTAAKRFVKNLMDSEAHIQIEYKNRMRDSSPYIWVTTSRHEGGSVIEATKQSKTWLMNYISKGEVGIIPEEDSQDKFTGHKDLAKDFLMLYLKGEKKANLKFFPLFTTGDKVKAVYHFPHGRIIFNVPKSDDLLNLMKDKEYVF